MATKTAQPEQLWTIPEAAELLKVSKNTVYRRIANGEIRVLDVGHRRAKTRIPASALAEYQERLCRTIPPRQRSAA